MTGDRALRVLNLVANRWWTGSADPALRLTLALRARGHHALLGLAPGDKCEAKAREAGVEPVEGLRLDVRSGPAAVLADLRRLRRLVREEALDVIHVHHSHDHWLGWWTHGGSALVRSYHNERAVRRGWPTSSLYRGSQALVAISRGVEERLIAAGAPARAVHRVGGVVDTARFATDSPGAATRRSSKASGYCVGSAPTPACSSSARVSGARPWRQPSRDSGSRTARSSPVIAIPTCRPSSMPSISSSFSGQARMSRAGPPSRPWRPGGPWWGPGWGHYRKPSFTARPASSSSVSRPSTSPPPCAGCSSGHTRPAPWARRGTAARSAGSAPTAMPVASKRSTRRRSPASGNERAQRRYCAQFEPVGRPGEAV